MSRTARGARLAFGLVLVALGLAPLSAAEPAPKFYRGRVDPVWLGEQACWYRNEAPNDAREFIFVDAGTGARRPALDPTRLPGVVHPIEALEYSPARDSVLLHGRDASWRLNLATYAVTRDDGASIKLPSSATTDRTTLLNILNESGGLLVAHCFTRQNGALPAFPIPPGGRLINEQSSDALWLIVDETGRTRAVLRPLRTAYTVTIDRQAVRVAAGKPAGKPAATAVRSPDGRWDALVRNHNLYLRPAKGGAEVALTNDATAADSFHADTSRDRLVGMNYDKAEAPPTLPEVFWSPDSRHLVALQTKAVPERRVYLTESSPSDQLQPKQHSYPYLKPGDPIPTRRPRLFHVADGREIPVATTLFTNPWQLTRFRWQPDSHSFTFLFNQRGHQVLRLLRVSAADGAVSPLIEERSPTFIHYSSSGSYQDIIDETGDVFWTSERSGWNHLYRIDAATGWIKNPVTQGNWVVLGVDRVDRQGRQIWFNAGGLVPGQDPYHVHVARVNFDGTGLTVLTAGDGTHQVRWSPRRTYFVDTWSRVDAPPQSVLRRGSDGGQVCALERADVDAIRARRGRWPERFTAKGRDGKTDIYGIILRPRDFDPTKKYPVIEHIYAGPHGFHTPKEFGAHDPLVDRGFIVVQLDGMGTTGRGKAFHDVCWQNLADAGFPDRIAWIKSAAAKYPEFDLSRVGIYGTSAGGQSALGALLLHGDFYHAAGADCGCHDNRMDKIWWNEQWMGWPVGPHYAANSNVTHAARLQGQLLLAVGELDRNVDPASTYQVANALIRAGKPFDYLVMPGAGHGVFRTPYGRQRLEDFFVKTFLSAP